MLRAERAIPLAAFFSLFAIPLHFSQLQATVIPLPCDLNGDTYCDCHDIDLITEAIGNGSDDIDLDLNNDGDVDPDDRDYLIVDLMNSPYGDVNADGVFDSSDLVQVFGEGYYDVEDPEEPVSYCDGDWNGDGVFNSADLVFIYQQSDESSAASSATPVPEPARNSLAILSTMLLFWRRAVVRKKCRLRFRWNH